MTPALLHFCALRDAQPRDERAYQGARTAVVLEQRTATERYALRSARRYKLVPADAIQLAQIGLLRALDNYDPGKGVALPTYAHWWMRAELAVGAEVEMLVRRPAYLAERHWRIWRAIGRAEQRGRALTDAEVCAAAKVTDFDLANDRAASWDRGAPIDTVERIRASEAPSAESEMIRHEGAALLEGLLRVLTERERDVVLSRWTEGDTMADAGERWGVSRERARQLYEGALEKMRRRIGSASADPTRSGNSPRARKSPRAPEPQPQEDQLSGQRSVKAGVGASGKNRPTRSGKIE